MMDVLDRVSRVIRNEAHGGGLNPVQWEALRYLDRANRFSRSPGALTTYLGATKGTVSQTLLALERKGLVSRSRDPADKRAVRIDLTASGQAKLAEDPLRALEAAVDALPADQRQRLDTDLRALLHQMLAARGGRPFGVCHTCRFFQRSHPEGQPHRCGLLKVALSADDSARICVEHTPAGE